jgi:hypothetical protein
VFERYADEEAVEMVDMMVSLLGADRATAVLSEMFVVP